MNRKIILAFALFFSTQSTFATPHVAVIKTAQELKSALGLIISGDSFQKYPADTITRVSPHEVHIIFSAPVPSANSESFVTAMGVSDAGIVLFSDLRLAENFSFPSKECRAVLNTPDSIAGRQSHLYSLLEIRGARRQVLREQLKLLTTQRDLKELNNLERLFGLDPFDPITRKTNTYELIDRLTRLKQAVKEMK